MSLNAHLVAYQDAGLPFRSAATMLRDAGHDMPEPVLRHAMHLLARYALRSTPAGFAKEVPHVVPAILHVALNHLHRHGKPGANAMGTGRNLAGCTGEHDHAGGRHDASKQYWIEKVCTALDIDTWISNSLETRYLDREHPFATVLLQVTQDVLMDQIACCLSRGSGVEVDALVEAITARLEGKFPLLVARFGRHLPGAIRRLVEEELLQGTPIDMPMDASQVAGDGGKLSLAGDEASFRQGPGGTGNGKGIVHADGNLVNVTE